MMGNHIKMSHFATSGACSGVQGLSFNAAKRMWTVEGGYDTNWYRQVAGFLDVRSSIIDIGCGLPCAAALAFYLAQGSSVC